MKRLILPLTLLIFASSACKKKTEDTSADAAASPSVSVVDEGVAAEAGAGGAVADDASPQDEGSAPTPSVDPSEFSIHTEIRVGSLGEAPRFPLRFDLQNMEFGEYTVRTTTSTRMGGMAVDPPPIVIPMSMELVERRGDTLRVRMKTGETRFEPDPNNVTHMMLAEQMAATMATESQPDISFDLHANGLSSNHEFHDLPTNEFDENMREALKSSVSQMTAQLPSEAVGVGAEWTLSQSLDVGMGQPITIEIVYHVREIQRDRALLGVRINKSEIDIEAVEGVRVSMILEGEGSATFVSNSPISETELNMRMDMDTGDPTLGRAQSTIRTTIRRN